MTMLPMERTHPGFMICDFEKLTRQDIETIIVTGTRAEELQLRLKLVK